jgi:hypothetical protein
MQFEFRKIYLYGNQVDFNESPKIIPHNKMKKCIACQNDCADDAESCPKCGQLTLLGYDRESVRQFAKMIRGIAAFYFILLSWCLFRGIYPYSTLSTITLLIALTIAIFPEPISRFWNNIISPKEPKITKKPIEISSLSPNDAGEDLAKSETVPPQASASQRKDRLQEVEELFRSGLITESEYQSKRAAILADL